MIIIKFEFRVRSRLEMIIISQKTNNVSLTLPPASKFHFNFVTVNLTTYPRKFREISCQKKSCKFVPKKVPNFKWKNSSLTQVTNEIFLKMALFKKNSSRLSGENERFSIFYSIFVERTCIENFPREFTKLPFTIRIFRDMWNYCMVNKINF